MYAYANNSFYPFSMREAYEASGSWPINHVEVEESVFTEFSATPPVGKIRGTGDDGMPAWVDIPPPTQEEIVAEVELKKANLRVLADSEINWRQDAVDAGNATEEEAAALADWKNYRAQLMRVNISKAPDIEWPIPPVVQG